MDRKRVFLLILSACLGLGALNARADEPVAANATPPIFLDANGHEFRLIPNGMFMTGNNATVEELLAKYPGGQAKSLATSPRRRVTLTQSFYLCKYPTTVREFRRFVEATGYKTTAEQKGSARSLDGSGVWAELPGLNWQSPGFPQSSKSPVTCVSYNDALAYVAWLNQNAEYESDLGGKPEYRLPTEAEWERACRANGDSEYFWGDEPSDGEKKLNAADESSEVAGRKRSSCFPFNDGFQGTSPVGSYEPNDWELYDMLGNVWEWCADGYSTYSTEAATDPIGDESSKYRVLRGGGWDAPPALARCAYRGANLPDACNSNYGFRVAFRVVPADASAEQVKKTADVPPTAPKGKPKPPKSTPEKATDLAQATNAPNAVPVEKETDKPTNEVARIDEAPKSEPETIPETPVETSNEGSAPQEETSELDELDQMMTAVADKSESEENGTRETPDLNAVAPKEETSDLTAKLREALDDKEKSLETRVKQLGCYALEGKRVVDDPTVARLVDRVTLDDYRRVSAAMKGDRDKIGARMKKELAFFVSLAVLGAESDPEKTPDPDRLNPKLKERATLLGGLVYFGLELRVQPPKDEPDVENSDE